MKIIFKLSLFIYVIGYIAHNYYVQDIDYIKITESQSHIEWYIRVFRDIGGMIAASLAIIISISSYPLSAKRNKEKAYIAISVLVSIIFLSLSSYAYYKMKNNTYQSSSILLKNERFKKQYDSNLKDENIEILKRVQYSNNIAGMIYRDTKTIINIIKPNGSIEASSPTTEDEEMRVALMQANKLMEHTKESFKGAIIVWSIILVFSTIVGVFLALRKKQLITNHCS